jgi:hypothetical protein
VPRHLAHYRGLSWRSSFTFGTGGVAWPIYVETTRSWESGTSSECESLITILPLRATAEIWPFYSETFAVAGFAEGGVGVMPQLMLWGGGGGRLRLGTHSIALLGELGYWVRHGGFGSEVYVAGVSSISVGEADYDLLRYGVGLRWCASDDDSADGCFVELDLWALVDEMDIRGAEPRPIVIRAGLTLLNLGTIDFEMGAIDRSYPVGNPPEGAPDVTEGSGVYFLSTFSLRWDLYGAPY